MAPQTKWTPSTLLQFLLPLSLLVAGAKIFHLPLYWPEVLTALYLIVVYQSEGKSRFRATWQCLPSEAKYGLLLLAIGLVGAVIFAPDRTDALGALKTWFLFPALFAWAFLADQKRSGKILVSGIVTFAIIETLYGAWLLLGATADTRLAGTLLSPNYYSAVIGPIIVLLIARSRTRWYHWLIAAGLVVGLLFSRSIGGVLGVVVGLTIFGYLRLRQHTIKPAVKWLLGVLLLLLIVIAALFATQRFWHKSSSSLTARIQIWHTAVYVGKIYPLTGSGLRGFDDAYLRNVGTFYDHPLETLVPEPHNLLLAFWLDTGLFGLLGVGALLAAVYRRGLLLPAQFALLAILGHGLVDTPFFKTELAFLFWFYIALCLVEKKDAQKA